MKLPAPL